MRERAFHAVRKGFFGGATQELQKAAADGGSARGVKVKVKVLLQSNP